ncbi:MAG: hypothetical protein COA71_01725 [SAR86 cluster bacterium]|uniref:FHA domain-containing protein n=1 Tax=SAR86 cluster bacterium TaxID=2030880 RepID=A0A2A5CJR9_9GAMM|nr:MAG: hypothetical protein COA71_01725 [SAR86 cluster bacterium]
MESLIIRVSRGGRSQPVFHRADNFPFRIGRAYDNDLIIADETVSAHHLEIHADENENGFLVKSIADENGTWIGKERLVDAQPELHDLTVPTTIHIGRTHLDLHAAHSPIEPTLIIARSSRLSEIASTIWLALGLALAYMLLTFYFAYQQFSLNNDWTEILVNRLLYFAIPIGIATMMSFISRMFLHSWRYLLQLSLASFACLVYLLTEELNSVISYFFTSQGVADFLILIFSGIFFAWIFAWQMRAISTTSVKRAAFVGIGGAWLILGLRTVQDIVDIPDFSTQPTMHNLVQRYDIRLSPSEESVSEFISNVGEDLQTGLTQELEKDRS